MKILFIGTSGVHHVLIAAHLFLAGNELSDIFLSPGFADMKLEQAGYPIYIGAKSDAKEVYVLGVGHEVQMAKRALNDLITILGFSKSDLLVVPIAIKGERLITLISKLPPLLGFVHRFTVKVLIKWQLETVSRQVEAISGYLYNR